MGREWLGGKTWAHWLLKGRRKGSSYKTCFLLLRGMKIKAWFALHPLHLAPGMGGAGVRALKHPVSFCPVGPAVVCDWIVLCPPWSQGPGCRQGQGGSA